jgi:hypothetical protein
MAMAHGFGGSGATGVFSSMPEMISTRSIVEIPVRTGIFTGFPLS